MSSITSAKGSIRSDHYDPSTASTIQSGRNWKAVILIPHQIWWKILIVITVLMNITIALYCLVFTNTHSTLSFTLVYYVCEITYFSDVVLAVIYRCKLMHNSGKLHFPRHALLLTIDIISLLPIHELYYIMEHCSSGDEDNTSRDHTRLKVILRLQYVISFSRDIKNYPGINQILVVIFKQFYILALYVVFAASLWFLLRNDSQSTWINHLEHMEIDRNSSFDWFVICVSVIANGYMHSSAGVISISSVPEYYIFSITMLVGCLMHVMIFFGELTSQHIQKFRHQLDFSKRLTIIIKMMRDWHTDEDSQKKTVEHYNKYWEMRQGMKNPPSIYKTLPLAMQKEVALDLFWDCLMHSQLFNECEINFKRSLSLRMNTEFYLPGDYLFSPNQQKHKMTYLASGIVQMFCNAQTPGANQQLPNLGNTMQNAMNSYNMFQQPQNNRSAYAHNTGNSRPATMPQSNPMNVRGMNQSMNGMQMGMDMQGMNMMGSGSTGCMPSPYSNAQPIRVDMAQQSQPNQWQQQQQMYGMNQQQMPPQSFYSSNPYQSQMGMSGMQYNGMPNQQQQNTYRSH